MCTWPVGQRSPSHTLVWLHLWILELKIAPSFLYFRSAGLHCFISPRLFKRIFSRKHQLRFLDCTQCDWVTDDSIQIVAENCPIMESLTLAKCRNIHGKSLPSLLSNCPKLKTLILEGTQIKDEFLGTADWENTNIIELNVLSCYRLSFSGLSAVLPKLRRLRYLKCALTDEILRLIVRPM